MLTRVSLAVVVAAALAAAGCGGNNNEQAGGTTTTAAAPAIKAPANIASAGQLVFCSDISYPPEEFYRQGKPVGSDMDIGNDVARRMGVTAKYDNTGFDGIVAALLSRKCDAIISGMNDTPERAKSVAFADYLSVGQSLIGKKGNPENINTPLDVCGKAAGAQVATTNLQTLHKFDAACKKAGKPAIKITPYKEDPLGVTALATGKIDVYESDSPPAVWYVTKDKSLQIVGQPIAALPVGIAVRPTDTELKAAIEKAIDAMYADGTMKKILARWNMSQFALKK